MDASDKRLTVALGLGAIGLAILPWYAMPDGLFDPYGFADYPVSAEAGPAIVQILGFAHWQLAPLLLAFAAAVAARLRKPSPFRANLLILAGAAGFLLQLAQGFAIDFRGWTWPVAETMFGALSAGQDSMGAGAAVTAACFLLLFSFGLAERGVLRGDAFVVASIVGLASLVTLFVFYPVGVMLLSSVQAPDGSMEISGLMRNLKDTSIWSLDCIIGQGRCGTAWNTLFLATCTAIGATGLGLLFALVTARTNFRYKKALRLLTVLPVVTPPFVIGLALILMFGRSGVVTQMFAHLFGVEAGRWLYGFPGIWLAQVLSFTPVAFLVLIGVVQGVSPSMEEASQTLRADRWRTFRKVSLPLMTPGLANAFLISFVESLADFGNPLVLGGSRGVLATEIYFAIVGAQSDPSRAAFLALVLLTFTLGAFLIQRLWLSGKNFATVTGKADSGINIALPRSLAIFAYCVVLPWAFFTLTIYAMILFGGFVKVWGLDHSLTLEHYLRAFSISFEGGLPVWTGLAWNSFWTTMKIALVSAPLTTAVGLLTAYLIVRQRFVGRGVFEFALMISFAIPGTVIGISYILAFNLPPIELTGTALILIACFVFRNMPVGVRSGIAAMSQLDKSLDEASLTLRANTPRTVRRVILPLLRPAAVSALVYSFVRSITSVSAIIFLVSAEYNLATTYIVGLVENSQYGVAIAYSSVLIVVMFVVINGFQVLVGKRTLRREDRITSAAAA